MKKLAIIGPTASGKSDLAIKIAQQIDAYILSIDSLSIYKEIDVVSAKPSLTDLNAIKHFGINVLNPDEYFSVDIFISLYKEVLKTCKKDSKNLVIVGGTSFYLKSLVEGLSSLPAMDEDVKHRVQVRLKELHKSYELLLNLDEKYMQKIDKNDSYRIEKALLIYEASGLTPSEWFKQNPPKPIIENLPIFNIDVERDVLRKRIASRSQKMLEMGLVDEVCILERKYSRLPHSMKSIGIVEVLDFLDGKVDKKQMIELISIHTAQLAKRQQTFNKTQFDGIVNARLEELEELILNSLSED
ncbi:tRNA (adenosine(37)-N6)-dimethylallyltransferase MiaA [Sulfurimonas sp.]|jgi:tRNA dimethylallyltransferase|uniref:tRNA (adenosine(37)-N6)-dimethylallyltransferase MiaA n=1 Tax=Sulfurimonas sp. TaxID=2022749 RepID=UPI0025D46E38|nr:tRNA (adenosine(37)-N6)-dimethylallyltransferase MiaA [Sulfurimonas sp.]MBT5934082.1 tRNA (adenosine(37)-N6)-dimethylallyltransferase MiaA [Sulfurimonas sp.]